MGHSPQRLTRSGGILYLLVILCAMFAQLAVVEQLVVFRNPSATAENIAANETLYRAGFVAHLTALVCALALIPILYQLFERVNRIAAMLMALFNIVSISIESVSILFLYEPLILLNSNLAVAPDQLSALVYVRTAMQSAGYDLALAFFGFFCIFTGYLIYTSALFPRIFGVLMVLAGSCYLINSYTRFLAPSLSGYLLPYILIPCFIGELAFALRLLLKGVNEERWKALRA